MKMKFFVSVIVLLQISKIAVSQNTYTINGLGRTIISRDKLSGPILNGDNTTPNKGVGGYLLFDMGNNLSIGNDFKVNATLRVRAPYGAFWGLGTEFSFRQFQIFAKVKKNIELQIGDINIGGLTPYTVNNFETEYHRYEAAVFGIRRTILEYENFNSGSDWRLQGVQAKGLFDLKSKYAKAISVHAFGTRTNPTNDVDVSDRILAGGRLTFIQSDHFQIGGNYVTMQDIEIANAEINYKNNVVTGNFSTKILDKNKIRLDVFGEAGFSDYNYSRDSAKIVVDFNDYVYDGGARVYAKKLKLIAFATYRDVGPNFTSPSAQTRRIDVTRTPALFPTIENKTVNRNQTLFDRFTDEHAYRRSLSTLWMQYLPQYNNITPYGRATANRRGFNGGIATDTSLKVLDASVEVDYLTEVIGEGSVQKREFFGARGGFKFNIDQVLKFKKRLNISAGARFENTTRKGSAPIGLTSTLIDLGMEVEVFNQFDLLLGMKTLNAQGNEFINTRDQFNQITSINLKNIDITENIFSVGFRLRFIENSFFHAAYTVSQYSDNTVNDFKYNIDQLFVNFTLKF